MGLVAMGWLGRWMQGVAVFLWIAALGLAASAEELLAPPAVTTLDTVAPDSWEARTLGALQQHFAPARNGAFRGKAPLRREEFAVQLARLLAELETQIATDAPQPWTRDDYEALRRLQQDFATELGVVRNRTQELTRQLNSPATRDFSAIAKLDGSVVTAITGGGGCGGCQIFTGVAAEPFFASAALGDALGAVAIPVSRANASFVGRTTLTLQTSFFGDDVLRIRMRGVTGQDVSAALPGIASGIGVLIFSGGPTGVSFDGSTVGVGTNGASPFTVDELSYQFALSPSLRVFIGPRLEISEYVDANSFANSEEIDFTGGLLTNSPLLTFVFFGPGFGFDWDISEAVSLRTIYLGNNGGAVGGDPRRDFSPFGIPLGAFGAAGLFGGESSLVSELEVRPSPGSAVRLQYGHLVDQGGILGSLTLPTRLANSLTDAWGFNFEWAITPGFALFGRYSFGNLTVNPLSTADLAFTPVALNTWQAGITFIDLGGQGNALGLTVAQPLRVFAGSAQNLIAPGTMTPLAPSGVETDIAFYYRLRLSDRVSLTPFVQFIAEPVNSRLSNGLMVGALRAVFEF